MVKITGITHIPNRRAVQQRLVAKRIIGIIGQDRAAGTGDLADTAQPVMGVEIINARNLLALREEPFDDVVIGIPFLAPGGPVPDKPLGGRDRAAGAFHDLNTPAVTVVGESGEGAALGHGGQPVFRIPSVGDIAAGTGVTGAIAVLSPQRWLKPCARVSPSSAGSPVVDCRPGVHGTVWLRSNKPRWTGESKGENQRKSKAESGIAESGIAEI